MEISRVPFASRDHPIVFAAQHYTRSGTFYQNQRDPDNEILATDGGTRLYRVNPDGSQLTPLTSGREDCSSCSWSPDGRFIAFDAAPCGKREDEVTNGYYLGTRHVYVMDASRRYRYRFGNTGNSSTPRWSPDGQSLLLTRWEKGIGDSRLTFCVSSIHGRGAAMPLIPFFKDEDESASASWSPDGKWVAILAGVSYSDKPRLYLVAIRSDGNVREIPGVREVAWAPDGQHLYLYRGDNEGQVLTLATGKVAPSVGIANALWLANGQIIGDWFAREQDKVPGDGYVQIGDSITGRTQRLILRKGASLVQHGPHGGDAELDYSYVGRRSWHPVPNHPDRYLLMTRDSMSDGTHHYCYLVDTRRGNAVYHPLRSGRFLGFAPDGRYFLVADYQWGGPYKRGGVRLGPLEVIETLIERRIAALSSGLSVIESADWRKSPSI